MLIINCAPGLHMNMISRLFLLILSKNKTHTKNGPRCSCHQDPTKGPELQHVYLQKKKNIIYYQWREHLENQKMFEACTVDLKM